MSDVEVVDDTGIVDTDASGEIERGPSRLLGAAAVAVLVVLVVLAVVGGDAEPEQDAITPSSVAAATTTTEDPTSAEPEDETDTVTTSRVDTTTSTAPSQSAGDTTLQPLPLDDGVLEVLPEGGVAAWLFASDGREVIRTDLETGEQTSLAVAAQAVYPIGHGVIAIEPGFVSIIDAATLDVTRHALADTIDFVTTDGRYVWLRGGDLGSLRQNFDLVRLDTVTGEVDEVVLDPLGTGFMVGGAAEGVIRVHAALVGSWHIGPDAPFRLDDDVIAGTTGGTIELRCTDVPGECEGVIRDMATGGETSIGDPPGFAMLLSPRLDTYVAFGELYRLDGTAEDLPFANGSGFGEDWLYSDDGSLLSNNSGTIVSVDGEFEPFRINRRRFAEARTTVITKPPAELDTTATTAAP